MTAPDVRIVSWRCPANTWHASASAPGTIGHHRPRSQATSSDQNTNGTLVRALVMLVWIRCAQTNPLRPNTAAPVSAPDGPTWRRSQPYVPSPVSQTDSTVSRLNACQVDSHGYSRYFSGWR